MLTWRAGYTVQVLHLLRLQRRGRRDHHRLQRVRRALHPHRQHRRLLHRGHQQRGQPAKVPIVAGEEGICKGCGVATLSISYYDLGYARPARWPMTSWPTAQTPPRMDRCQYAPKFTKEYNATICTGSGHHASQRLYRHRRLRASGGASALPARAARSASPPRGRPASPGSPRGTELAGPGIPQPLGRLRTVPSPLNSPALFGGGGTGLRDPFPCLRPSADHCGKKEESLHR
jgi:hypothetical protein